MPEINSTSIRTVLITPVSTAGVKIASASGFFIERDGGIYLVTNQHVLTGLNTFTGNEIELGVRPFELIIDFEMFIASTRNTFRHIRKSLTIPLYEKMREGGTPSGKLWLDHGNKKIDVAVINITSSIAELTQKTRASIKTFFEDDLISPINISVMDEVFIAGFPLKSNLTPNQYPIYKHATVASEPSIYNDLPMFFVDGKTKKGMSGGPVVHRARAMLDNNGAGKISFSEGRQVLVGVYSGRLPGEDEYEAELGICWRLEESINPLINS